MNVFFGALVGCIAGVWWANWWFFIVTKEWYRFPVAVTGFFALAALGGWIGSRFKS
jgi:hypothetical protein